MTLPPDLVAVDIGKGCLLVIPKRVYLAGLRLGKILRRREAEAKRFGLIGPHSL